MGKKTIPLRAIGVDSSTLIIPNVMISDSGLYKCVVSSGDVSVISKVGNVSILSKLLIYNSFAYSYVQTQLSQVASIMYVHAIRSDRVNNGEKSIELAYTTSKMIT